jgi:Holliday junction DNA helicase RuvA
MYSFISGRVAEVSEDTVTVENHGIGYELSVSAFTAARCEVGSTVSLYCRLSVREDGVSLLGFYDKTERQLFLRLISVGGVGPKAALTVLSGLPVSDLAAAILTGDIKTLSRIKGVGKKTAERIVLELKEKVATLVAGVDITVNTAASGVIEATEALTALGFSRTDAVLAVNGVENAEKLTAEELITSALRSMKRA